MSGSMISQTFCSYADLGLLGAMGGSSETGPSHTGMGSSSTPMKTPGTSRSWSTEGIPSDAIRNTREFIWLLDPKTGKHQRRTHGKKATYSLGCRCDRCREGYRVTCNARALRVLETDGPVRYDGDMIRDHIDMLRREFNISPAELARLAGMSKANVLRILDGTYKVRAPKTVMKHVGDKILAVTGYEDEVRAPTGSVYSALSSKRLRSLAALGYTPTDIWSMVYPGRVNPHSSSQVYRALIYHPERNPTIRVFTAQGILQAYREIGDKRAYIPESAPFQSPEGTQKAVRMRILNYAKAHGWGTPASWEDPGTLQWPYGGESSGPVETAKTIDWVLVERMSQGERHPCTFEEKTEAVRLMLQRNVGRNEIRRQLGISTQTWRKIERCI